MKTGGADISATTTANVDWHGRQLSAEEAAEIAAISCDWMWETDAQHRFTWFSDSFEEASGGYGEKMLGRSRLEFVETTLRDGQTIDEHRAILAARKPFRNLIFKARTVSGRNRWVCVSGVARFSENGEFLGYRGTGHDVTAQLSAVEELNEARKELSLKSGREKLAADTQAGDDQAGRLMAALDVMQDAFCYFDADDRLVLYNKAFVDFYPQVAETIQPGVTFEELLDAGLERGVYDTGETPVEAWRAEVLRRRREHKQRESVVKVGDRVVLHRDMRTQDGGTLGVKTDITDIKHKEEGLTQAKREAEAANRRSEHLLKDLHLTLDTLRMGVVLLNSDMTTEIINRAFFDIWKLEPGSVEVGSHFRKLMDINRDNGIYGVDEEDWEGYVSSRVDEISAGDVSPREFKRADGCTMVYSVAALTGGKRLVCYYDITEIKDREEQLENALEKTQLADAVINSVRDPIFVKDANLDFVLVNQAFADIFGTEPDKMIGHKGSEFVSAEEAAEFEASERDVLAGGEEYQVEEDFELDGAPQSRIVRKSLVSLPGGKDYVACSIFDVSELKMRVREAKDMRAQLEMVVESLPAGVLIYDRDNRLVVANRQVRDPLPKIADVMQPGRHRDEILRATHDAGYFRRAGDEALDALYDKDREAWVAGFAAKYDVPQAVYERQVADDRWHKVFDMRTPEGFFIGVRVDITDQKRRENELQEATRENELYRTLIDNVPVAIYAKRPDLKLLYVNNGWCELTGLTVEDAIGRTDAEIFGADGEALMEGDRALLRDGKRVEFEECITHPDGTVRYQMARKSVMTANDGSTYLIGSTTDVTELKNREAELEAERTKAELADRAKSEFLANMSHEIRTPMNGVLGMAELVSKTDLDSKQRTFIDIILKSGNALLTIINDILDFSKIDAGQLVLDPAPFDLTEAIEDVATLVSTRAKEKDLELIVRVEPGLHANYVGDVGRIRQIVTNLMGNAVKFTESGHVLVDVTGQDLGDGRNRLEFSITDTGIGIPEDKLALIFDKFSQVDASSTRRHEGTGLGLAITQRLIELMGGDISVESVHGEGSTFYVHLDLERAGRQEPTRSAPLDVTGARVLIVDDNAVNRSIYSEQMEAWRFDACAADCAEEGLQVLRAAVNFNVGVDCLILDYQMPGMNGADMAKLMSRDPQLSEVPIVILTSVDQALSGAAGREANIVAQLVKPVRSSQLLETVVAAIQKRRENTTSPADRDLSAFKTMRAPKQVDAKPADRQEAAPAPAPVHEPATASKTPPAADSGLDVLVAEDNEVNQLVFTQILGETDLRFELVGNGKLAVEAYGEKKPRMILMDVSMPEMNGLEATGAIRELEAESGVHVPIVGVTAHALKGDRERCIESGMDDYLSKPISPKALLEKVQAWLDSDGTTECVAGQG